MITRGFNIELYYASRKRNNVELAVRQSGSEAARRGAERAASAGGDSSSASILKVGNLCLSLFLLEHANEIWQPSAPPPPRSGSAAAVVTARCHFCIILFAVDCTWCSMRCTWGGSLWRCRHYTQAKRMHLTVVRRWSDNRAARAKHALHVGRQPLASGAFQKLVFQLTQRQKSHHVTHHVQVVVRELDGTVEHALHMGQQPLALGRFKVATRPSAWARRPKRKPQPGEDTALAAESDGKCRVR